MASEMPKFIVLTGPEEGLEFSLKDKTRLRLGRFEDNDLIFSDTSVSRHHATGIFKEGKWFIRDENSRNGTWVNEANLKPSLETPLSNLDVVKLGVYDLRYVDKNSVGEEVKETKKVPLAAKEDVVKETAAEAPVEEELVAEQASPATTKGAEGTPSDKEELASVSEEITSPGEEKIKMGKGWFVFIVIAALFCLLGVGLYIAFEHGKDEGEEEVKEEVVLPGEVVSEEVVKSQEVVTPEENVVPQVQTPVEKTPEGKLPEPTFTPIEPEQKVEQPPSAEFSVFLDVKTTPLPATVYFQDKRLGLAPLKENLNVEPGKVYDVYVDYELREINDIYRKKASFTVKPGTDVVELKIDADIGVLKIHQLPPKTEFYLEGYYDYDKERANPVKITDIVYGKPIYLPFGRYIVQLKEQTQVAGSTNFTTEIRFERSYEVNQDNRVLELTISEKDIKLFPAVIRSVPSNAQVFLGDELVGTTPFDGKLPIGKSEIKIKKDGYFVKTIPIEMNKNAIYETEVVLKTSESGELINKAKEELRHEQYDEAINTLVTALKYGGSAHEKAQIYFLLGDTYLKQGKHEQAAPYFEKAKTDKSFTHRATLGLVRTRLGLNQGTQALKEIVEVLATMDEKTPSSLRNEANAVFKLVSPVKSVVYLYTDPPGATVFVNDKPLLQVTPLILSDLSLGNYRLQFEKTGYEVFSTKQNVRIGEFVMVKVKLSPQKN